MDTVKRRRKAKKYVTDEERWEAIRANQRRRYHENKDAEHRRMKERSEKLRVDHPMKARIRHWKKNGNAAIVVRAWYREQFRRSERQQLEAAAVDAYAEWFESLDAPFAEPEAACAVLMRV